MNSKERKKYFAYVLEHNGAYCGRCRKDVNQLRSEWELANPNQARKLPYLNLHHIDGDERFPHSRDGTYCGNLMLCCFSCNQLLRRREIAPDTLREKTPEMLKNETSKPKFLNWLDNYLANFSNICKERMLNRGSLISGVVQQTAHKYFKQEHDYRYVEFNIEEHECDRCNYKECKGIHICLKKELPRKVDLIGRIVHEEEGKVVE